jgi:hypothetical protein
MSATWSPYHGMELPRADRADHGPRQGSRRIERHRAAGRRPAGTAAAATGGGAGDDRRRADRRRAWLDRFLADWTLSSSPTPPSRAGPGAPSPPYLQARAWLADRMGCRAVAGTTCGNLIGRPPVPRPAHWSSARIPTPGKRRRFDGIRACWPPSRCPGAAGGKLSPAASARVIDFSGSRTTSDSMVGSRALAGTLDRPGCSGRTSAGGRSPTRSARAGIPAVSAESAGPRIGRSTWNCTSSRGADRQWMPARRGHRDNRRDRVPDRTGARPIMRAVPRWRAAAMRWGAAQVIAAMERLDRRRGGERSALTVRPNSINGTGNGHINYTRSPRRRSCPPGGVATVGDVAGQRGLRP